eukprot:357473-Chlamydomonas_euryale.AAC.10
MSESVEAVPMAGHSQEARNSAVRAVLKGLEDLNAVVFFEKSLTSSDASGSGRVVIPKVGYVLVRRRGQRAGAHRGNFGILWKHGWHGWHARCMQAHTQSTAPMHGPVQLRNAWQCPYPLHGLHVAAASMLTSSAEEKCCPINAWGARPHCSDCTVSAIWVPYRGQPYGGHPYSGDECIASLTVALLPNPAPSPPSFSPPSQAIAEQYFPRLEQANGIPVNATDTRGRTYTFKFRFWINNQSRMYLLEGAGELHRAFEMSVGDVMVFAQKPDGELIMAGRPATKVGATKRRTRTKHTERMWTVACCFNCFARQPICPCVRPSFTLTHKLCHRFVHDMLGIKDRQR